MLLRALAPKLEPRQAQVARDLFLEAMRQTSNAWAVLALARAIQVLEPTPEQSQSVVGHILELVGRTSEPGAPQVLVEAALAFGPSITREQADAALAPVLQAFWTDDEDRLQALAQAVQALGPSLTPAEAEAALASVLEAIGRTGHASPLQALARVTQTLGPKVQKGQREDVIETARTVLSGDESPRCRGIRASHRGQPNGGASGPMSPPSSSC